MICAELEQEISAIAIELLVVYFLFVETAGSSLEEKAAIIDGEEVRDTIVEAVARATDCKAMHGTMDDKHPQVAVA